MASSRAGVRAGFTGAAEGRLDPGFRGRESCRSLQAGDEPIGFEVLYR